MILGLVGSVFGLVYAKLAILSVVGRGCRCFLLSLSKIGHVRSGR